MHRIGAKLMPANTMSSDLVRRLGFTYEGIQRETFKLQGRYEDLGVYSMLADEWRERA